jgi:hypothetical protein
MFKTRVETLRSRRRSHLLTRFRPNAVAPAPTSWSFRCKCKNVKLDLEKLLRSYLNAITIVKYIKEAASETYCRLILWGKKWQKHVPISRQQKSEFWRRKKLLNIILWQACKNGLKRINLFYLHSKNQKYTLFSVWIQYKNKTQIYILYSYTYKPWQDKLNRNYCCKKWD